ncbi:MAG: hypothetical protein KA085_03320 [Phenylobacterium sp.]|jgi:hypothetical protein|uniref:hypothetical protein n=1 Tax=Phenylobacterium sp. TaxID=1871053 RepID=UPI001B579100|nr:hypothetical protein [Phenylobacterium sp.]MBP7651459.1 hypothetical protein [Phenylobacterium sp.]MBP7815130.1 hypothetical protein [Phenylobacterium sp.]MBP9232804.1 hypothetical protein [Phenylobacterium sp.]MBP9754957.1 hypothetical protein [Phenylobacterium sp.]
MTLLTSQRIAAMSFRQAFDAERLKRETERRAREDAERARQEADEARSIELYEILAADPGFLAEKKLVLERSRYTVGLEHADFRLRAYFEDAQINVTAADKRSATTITAAPTKQQSVESVEQALDVLAQYLADETA